MKRFSLILILCAGLTALVACGSDTPPAESLTSSVMVTATESTSETTRETESEPIIETKTDTATDTVTDIKTDTVTETESETENETETDDGFDAVRASDEAWLSYGLDAYLTGREAPDLSDFFSELPNMSYLTLYADMFLYDEAKTVPVAEAFFRFVADTYGKDALTDTERRIEYKSAYLASLGVEGGYLQDPAVEVALTRMTARSNDEWKYILTLDNATYYLNDFSQGGIGQYHAVFYYHVTGLAEMIDYIETHMPNAGLHTGRHFHYYMTFDGSSISYTTPDGRMYINEIYSMLHESLHAMGLNEGRDDANLWLSEGLCTYFGKLAGFNRQYALASAQLLRMAAEGAFDDHAAAGNISALFYKRLYTAYAAAGGSIASPTEFDLMLHNDLWAALERSMLGDALITIADGYKHLNGKEYTAPGTELTYTEATSMVTYLIEAYGADRVMTACRSGDMEGTLGKSYEELKALWQTSLPVV